MKREYDISSFVSIIFIPRTHHNQRHEEQCRQRNIKRRSESYYFSHIFLLSPRSFSNFCNFFLFFVHSLFLLLSSIMHYLFKTLQFRPFVSLHFPNPPLHNFATLFLLHGSSISSLIFSFLSSFSPLPSVLHSSCIPIFFTYFPPLNPLFTFSIILLCLPFNISLILHTYKAHTDRTRFGNATRIFSF